MNKLSGTLLQVVLFILFVSLAAVDGWGNCSTGTDTSVRPENCTGSINVGFTCKYSYYKGSCTYRVTFGQPYNVTMVGTSTATSNVRIIQSCSYNTNTDNGDVHWIMCTTACESDSTTCMQNGGNWTNTGASTCDGKSCKFSNCLQSDTLWLNDSKAACDAIGGENNYAITDIDETCVHSGICCPPDSALVGNTCKWRCDSLYTACTAKNGYLYAGVLQDTTISGADSTFTNKCYYNCSYAYNKDSTTSVTDGNTACSSPSTPIADCTRMPNDFSSVRTTYGDSVYSYDFLTPGSAAYIDSIVLTPCSRFMYRCTINGKYKYWYSDADIPTGCTNIVKIK